MYTLTRMCFLNVKREILTSKRFRHFNEIPFTSKEEELQGLEGKF